MTNSIGWRQSKDLWLQRMVENAPVNAENGIKIMFFLPKDSGASWRNQSIWCGQLWSVSGMIEMCIDRKIYIVCNTLQWRHNGHDSVSNHQPHDCLLNGLLKRRSKKTSRLRVTGLCAGNSPGTGEFPAQMASNAENVSIWWRHHETLIHNILTSTVKNYLEISHMLLI